MAILPPWQEVGEQVAEGGGAAAHFQADVETFAHAEFALDIGKLLLSGIDDMGCASFLASSRRQGFTSVGRRHGVRRRGARRRRHAADRAGAGDQHVLAQDVERQGSMHGVAKGSKMDCTSRPRFPKHGCHRPNREARHWSSEARDIRQTRRGG